MLLVTGFEWYWSWVLGVVPLFAMWQIGNRHRWAFLLMASGEVLWMGWAILTRQWGFVPGSIIWGGVSVRNWANWRKEAPANPTQATETV